MAAAAAKTKESLPLLASATPDTAEEMAKIAKKNGCPSDDDSHNDLLCLGSAAAKPIQPHHTEPGRIKYLPVPSYVFKYECDRREVATDLRQLLTAKA